METLWYLVAFVFGTLIGSFLNVVLYRLHTGRSLHGRSHCMSCGKVLTWYELLPIFSYLVQGGRCRACHSRVPSRYLWVEVMTGTTFLLLWHEFSSDLMLLIFYTILFSILIVIVVYDIRHTIIPDELTALVGILALLFLGYEFSLTSDFMLTLSRIGAGLVAAVFFWGLWYVSKGRWIGLGDAKLALPLGTIVGLSSIFSFVVLSFWIGALVSVLLLCMGALFQRGKTQLRFLSAPSTIKSEVPFAPFLVAGFLSVQLFHADIFDITYTLFFSWL